MVTLHLKCARPTSIPTQKVAGNLEMVLRLEGVKPSGKGPTQATHIQILGYGPGVWKGCEVKRETLNPEIAPK